jgi:hypothetical protein
LSEQTHFPKPPMRVDATSPSHTTFRTFLSHRTSGYPDVRILCRAARQSRIISLSLHANKLKHTTNADAHLVIPPIQPFLSISQSKKIRMPGCPDWRVVVPRDPLSHQRKNFSVPSCFHHHVRCCAAICKRIHELPGVTELAATLAQERTDEVVKQRACASEGPERDRRCPYGPARSSGGRSGTAHCARADRAERARGS